MKKISPSDREQDLITSCSPKIEAVDLGLSVKWANANLGAAAPEQFGMYYAWGEIETKTIFSWSSYKWCLGANKALTKYCYKEEYGKLDRKTWWLEQEDDVVHVKLGEKWHTPNRENWNELRHNCSWAWKNINGINGLLVSSMIPGFTDKSIFLPAAGYREDEYCEEVGSRGFYWSSSLYLYCPGLPSDALLVFFDSRDIRTSLEGRMLGCSIRPVSD